MICEKLLKNPKKVCKKRKNRKKKRTYSVKQWDEELDDLQKKNLMKSSRKTRRQSQG